ncbi:MAG: hypothetical protein U0791_05895 [Gemmataceae bacterium]
MDDRRRQQLDWLPGSPWLKPDWRLRRARYLVETGGAFDDGIDDSQIERAVAEFRHVDRRNRARSRKLKTLQEVLNLASKSGSPLRWKLEALLLTDCPLAQIGAVLNLSESFVSAYHTMVFHVRPRRRATDWLIRFAMGRPRPDAPASERMEYAWKLVALSGGVNLLQATIAITTGAPFPQRIRASFTDPEFDDACLRLRGKLAIGAMIATTREEWRALVLVRRQLRRLDSSYEREINDKHLQIMESQLATLLTHAAPGGEKPAPTRSNPVKLEPRFRGGNKDDQPHATVGFPTGQRGTGDVPIRATAPAVHFQAEGEAHRQHRDRNQGADPLAFIQVQVEEDLWSSFDTDATEGTVETGQGRG